VALAGSQAEPAQPAVLVADAVALGRAPAAGAADRLRLGAFGGGESPFSAPAAARWAGTTVVSIISRLLGWRCWSSSKIRCQIPCFAQRRNRL
jgi:hypothetical protein